MAYDSAHGKVVLFGGVNAANYLFGDTWVWDGSNWTQKFPQTSPPAREAHAMAYDSTRGQVVLFGGNGAPSLFGPGYLNDTWVWDGSNWTKKSPPTSPPARFAHAMAYDSARGQVVLFGGTSANLFADTWVWDGANWTQKSLLSSPPVRTFGAMAYDSAHGQVVLFGGNSNGVFLNDTWVWDGSNWMWRLPPTSPPARDGHAMAYDSAHGEVVLFGGLFVNASTLSFSDFNDTWVWNGSIWTKESPQISPLARDSHAMAYDAAHDLTVSFGGANVNAVILSDTWTWNGGPLAVSPPSISGVVSASDFGGFSSVAPGSWVEIYGSNLAPDTRGWAAADFTGNNAPTSLDGVSVTIGGQAAFVDYISATQVNAQLPSNISTGGALPLTVTKANVTSAPVGVTVHATEPGLLAPASFKIGANQYVWAQLPDGNYVLPAGAIAGVGSRPAKPGETIVIYGIGFGSVVPDTPAGQIAPGTSQLSAPLQLLFGQTPALQVPYAGLAPTWVGLYQFNVVVPPMPDSDLVPLTFTLGGVAGTQTLVTAVHQ
jgi:uncharacterized protein (TIGR03437 family)